jgi:hypothetical protein
MAERTNIPSSPACGQWETLLADALDGLLKPEDEATFTAHMAICPACTALFEEARRGREWLEFLSPEPEVPAGLLDKILAQTGSRTGGRLRPGSGAATFAHAPAWQRPGFGPDSPLCRAPPADDGGHGLLLHRSHAQPDRRPLSSLRLSDLRPHRGALVHGAPPDHGLHADHPLLRPPALCLRGGVQNARAAPQHRGRRQGEGQPAEAERPAPGESKQNPGHKDGGSRVDPPQQSVNPAH